MLKGILGLFISLFFAICSLLFYISIPSNNSDFISADKDVARMVLYYDINHQDLDSIKDMISDTLYDNFNGLGIAPTKHSVYILDAVLNESRYACVYALEINDRTYMYTAYVDFNKEGKVEAITKLSHERADDNY